MLPASLSLTSRWWWRLATAHSASTPSRSTPPVATAGDEVVEDTLDWYAQDTSGNVWYFGEDTKQLEHGKVVGTRLQDADYAAMARSFGMHAERVETEEQLGPAIQRALANRPALLDMVVTPEAISSDGKTGLAWVPDLQPLAAWDEAERKWRAS